jgi:hypothetical protein
MLFFDGADRILVQGRAAQRDAGRGAIPIQQPRSIAGAIRVHQERIFNTASVAGQTKEWHGLAD